MRSYGTSPQFDRILGRYVLQSMTIVNNFRASTGVVKLFKHDRLSTSTVWVSVQDSFITGWHLVGLRGTYRTWRENKRGVVRGDRDEEEGKSLQKEYTRKILKYTTVIIGSEAIH